MIDVNTEWRGPEELAAFLGVPVRTVYAWRSRGKGPRAHRIGRHIRFRSSDVEVWLTEQAEERPGGPLPATPPSAAA